MPFIEAKTVKEKVFWDFTVFSVEKTILIINNYSNNNNYTVKKKKVMFTWELLPAFLPKYNPHTE